MKKDICKGCGLLSCWFIIYKCEEKCPCIDCLVKVMCNDWCDERDAISKRIHNFNHGMLHSEGK